MTICLLPAAFPTGKQAESSALRIAAAIDLRGWPSGGLGPLLKSREAESNHLT